MCMNRKGSRDGDIIRNVYSKIRNLLLTKSEDMCKIRKLGF